MSNAHRPGLGPVEQRSLIAVTGKGGVGKTTVAAALGLALGARGRRVLLLELDPRESLYRMLDVAPSGGEIVRALDGVWLQNLQPRAVLDAVVRETIGIDLLSGRVLRSPVYRHFAEGAPGLKEIAVLGHVLRVLRGIAGGSVPAIDVVVLDAPATGHGLSLLTAPGLVAAVIEEGPFGRMAGELATFVADPVRCGVVVCTQAEEMPVQETIELLAEVGTRLARTPDLLVVNGLWPEPRAGSDDEHARFARDRVALQRRELERLRAAFAGPRAELPYLPLDRGPALVAALSERIEAGVAESV